MLRTRDPLPTEGAADYSGARLRFRPSPALILSLSKDDLGRRVSASSCKSLPSGGSKVSDLAYNGSRLATAQMGGGRTFRILRTSP